MHRAEAFTPMTSGLEDNWGGMAESMATIPPGTAHVEAGRPHNLQIEREVSGVYTRDERQHSPRG